MSQVGRLAPARTAVAGVFVTALTAGVVACGAQGTAGDRPDFECADQGDVSLRVTAGFAQPATVFGNAYSEACPGAVADHRGTDFDGAVRALGEVGVDLVGVDRPISASLAAETSGCAAGVRNLPVVLGAVAVVHRVPGAPQLRLSAGVLARVFTGAITRWNDPLLQADNPSVPLPDIPITVLVPSPGQSAARVFSEYLDVSVPELWRSGGNGPVGRTVRSGADLATEFRAAAAPIAVADWGYALAQRASIAVLRTEGDPDGVELNARTVAGTADRLQALTRGTEGIVVDTGRAYAGSAGAYPLVVPEYLAGCAGGTDDDRERRINAYLGTAVAERTQAAIGEGYAPLPPDLRARVAAAIG